MARCYQPGRACPEPIEGAKQRSSGRQAWARAYCFGFRSPDHPVTRPVPAGRGSPDWRDSFKLQISLAMVAILLLQPASAQVKDDPAMLTDRIAAHLLDQVREGLEARLVKKALGSFDLSRMSGGPAFKNQIAALLNQYESVRVHFNLLETSTAGAEATVTVDVEMEENLSGDVSAPVHKHAQLRFVAQNGAKGWKFTDVQPRSFFS